MQNNSTEPACLICGAPLRYLENAREMTCEICGRKYLSNAACMYGHFVCDNCHAAPATTVIRSIALAAVEKDPFVIATAMMQSPAVHMHGPEHHILAGTALLAAYRNAGGVLDLPAAVDEMFRRGAMVPGGFCGIAGACGAAISAGMFYSIATKTNPLSTQSWGEVNLLTAACLTAIGSVGGPRCCKRDTYLALEEAVEFVREHTGITMELPAQRQCGFSNRNHECLRERCPYYFPE
ncbi:DUF5714 domain-containing protein [Methanocorpusculum sp. MG]|uniref:DUF5714 domain-containing protein n=1 Tax=Methanocorpusculum petauri TaxID=3002863 RepID=A0ABT4II32_9EURY|nr:DUF5714 domain-containing protein [Methanocorpusculum petauri]MCZ0861412.1 DUF5714 domain-containing protein [Methanocorpusculum petauri]